MLRIDVPDGRDPLLHLWSRLNQVFGVDEACRIPLAPHGPGHQRERGQPG